MYTACGYQGCRNTLLMRSIQSRVGITLGQRWYCGIDCFARAASTQVIALSKVNRDPRHVPRIPLELILLAKGYMTDRELKAVADRNVQLTEPMETTLIRHGLVSEKQIAAARSAQWGCPVLGRDQMGFPVRTDIPRSLLGAYSVVPVQQSDSAKRVLVGFVYRVEHSFLSAVEAITDLRADPCFITATEYEEQMASLPQTPNGKEVIASRDLHPEQICKTVGGIAIEIAVRDARFARCRDHVWLRLVGKRSKVDLLFHVESKAV